MPNNCYNGLKITGDIRTVAQIFEKHFPADEEGVRRLDFNTILPYPQRFLDQDKVCEEHRKANPNDWMVTTQVGTPGASTTGELSGTLTTSKRSMLMMDTFKWNSTPRGVRRVEFMRNSVRCILILR